MKKFKEILFLKNLKRVGNVAINGKYFKILDDSIDLDDLFKKLQNVESKFSIDDLEKAKTKANEVSDYIDNSDINVLTIFDENYPENLSVMKNNKPPILYIKGDIKALEKPNIAIIGTRNPSELSENFETNLVKNIVNLTDKVVVSGLALGCDKIAHQTTVDENKITVAVLPSGVDSITPAKHKELAEDIIKMGGCLVSEYEPKINANRGSFVKRDKIVAALCDATFVVECSIGSGTLHTVKAAHEFKKPIFSYLPDEQSNDLYDGNEFILNEYVESRKVEDIKSFIKDLENLNFKNESVSVQQKLC